MCAVCATASLLAEYRQLGFTRLSILKAAACLCWHCGCIKHTRITLAYTQPQDLLRACGRAHGTADVAAALSAVAASGFPSWSLDLMSGLPGLTRAAWRQSLQSAIAAAPPHISVYDLQIEEGTPFAKWYSPGDAPLPPDGDAAEMYADAVRLLTAAGYEHYEVSNYASPGHRSRHNQVYWRGGGCYAFGLGAASYLAGRRYSRPKGMQQYEAWVAEFEASAAAAGGGGGLPGGELPEESQVRVCAQGRTG